MTASKPVIKDRDVDQMISDGLMAKDREVKAAIAQVLAEAQKENKAFVEGLLEINGVDAEGLTDDMVESIVMDLVKERDREGRGLLSYDLWRRLGRYLVEREECDREELIRDVLDVTLRPKPV